MCTNWYCWRLMELKLPNRTAIKTIPFAQMSLLKSQEAKTASTKMQPYSPFYFPHVFKFLAVSLTFFPSFSLIPEKPRIFSLLLKILLKLF